MLFYRDQRTEITLKHSVAEKSATTNRFALNKISKAS